MKSTVFANLSEKRRAGVQHLIDSWKRQGNGVDVLEESLRYLSSDSREPASALLGTESEVADLCCTYGKGPRARLALSKDDASMLLTIVIKIREAGASEEMTSRMISRAFSILIVGRLPSSGQSDDTSRKLLDILGVSDPGLKQGSLF